MFVAQAHSFVQQARLAVTLAWVAGYTNIITILVCGTVTSHVSGTTSNLGRDVVESLRGDSGAGSLAAYALFLLVTFALGAMLSGLATEIGRRRGWDSIYVLPMALEALMLAGVALAMEVLEHAALTSGPWHFAVAGLASGAMGLQNATITRISAGVVRTTHVTGVLTDLGMEFVQFCFWARDRARAPRGEVVAAFIRSARIHPTPRRLALLAAIMGTFALGAGLGTVMHDLAPRFAMIPPVVFLLWLVYQDAVSPIVEIERSGEFNAESVAGMGDRILVFHLRADPARANRTQQMPNLVAWADRLPPPTRVVILDLEGVTTLGRDAAAELHALEARLHAEGRRLLIAGLRRDQLSHLRRAAGGADPAELCPDLELAIARAMTIVDGPREPF